MYATEGRKWGVLGEFRADLEAHGRNEGAIEELCMDMSAAYIREARESFPDAGIAFDRFHVVKLLNGAVDGAEPANGGRDEPMTRDIASIVLVVISVVGCDNSPVEPTPVTPVEVTITVVDPHPETTGVPGATVTCLAGCEDQQVGTTDSLGQTTLTGVEPLSVRVEKDRYFSVEQQVSNGDTIVLEREPVEVTITVVDPHPETTGVPGATVTCLAGCEDQQVGTTDSLGQTTLTGVEPLSVRAEKDRYFSVEQQVSNGDSIALQRQPPVEVTITVVLPHRSDEILPGTFAQYGINYFGVEGANVTCLDGCPDRQTQPTDDQGEVTFIGMPTLRVRVEKAGYIPVTRTVSVDGEANGEVVVSHEWPAELAVAIRQLELEDVIASGDLLLNWNTNQPNKGMGNFFEAGFIQVDVFRNDRLASVWTLFHEAMHAWQWLKSGRPLWSLHCLQETGCPDVLIENWHRSDEAQAWLVALEKDIRDHGPMHGLDVGRWSDDPVPFYKNPLENMASFFAEWNIGPCSRKRGCGNRREERAKLYARAPNRAAYMEHYFGSPPLWR